MNRSKYFDYIEEKINTLATRINSRGKLNILDLHIHSENFYRDFLNKLYDFELKNLNDIKQNVESIDLISESKKIVVQVSATCTKEKIESTLKKESMSNYKDYTFYFVSISKDATDLRGKTYDNPYGITFEPTVNIYDTQSLIKLIGSLPIDDSKRIYEFIKKELGEEINIVKLDSNLATVVDILSKENLDKSNQTLTLDSFEIERKISHNNLNSASYIIKDYIIHHNRLDKIYSEFDISGVNKSNSVLVTVRGEYVKNMNTKKDDDLFFLIINNVQEKILSSSNFVQIPIDELEQCVNIIVVDAFIRCKIFENPNDYQYATTR